MQVGGLSGVDELSAGSSHNCADEGSTTYCWGENNHGQLGDGTINDASTPQSVSSISSGVSVSGGLNHTCIVDGGEAWCWGEAMAGALGIGPTNPDQLSPVEAFGVP